VPRGRLWSKKYATHRVLRLWYIAGWRVLTMLGINHHPGSLQDKAKDEAYDLAMEVLRN
jgi:hypothetical protein